MLQKDRSLYFYIFPMLVVLVSVIAFPAGMTVYLSFTRKGGLGFGNYGDVLQDKLFWIALKNTVIYTLGSVSLHLLVGLGVAVLLNAIKRGRIAFRIIALIPWAFPFIVVAVTWSWMFDPQYGVINDFLFRIGAIKEPILWLASPKTALPSLLLTNVWRGFPWVSLTLLAAIQVIPKEQYEAASIDGASTIKRFIYVTLPNLKRMLGIIVTLDFIWTFRQFDIVWIMTGGGPGNATEMMTSLIYRQSFEFLRFEYASAVALLMTLLVFALSLVVVRYVQKD